MLISFLAPMELEPNLGENLSSRQSENSGQVCIKKDEFQFQVYSSKSYLQDFHHLDHFHPTVNLLPNPVFTDQNPCFDPFNPYYGCSSSNIDLYECKPCADQTGGNGQVMDNFNIRELSYNFHQRNRMENSLSDPLNFKDIKPVNFVVPDEVSCITSGNAMLPSLIRTYKGRKKSNVIKGQWTVEEDRLLVQLVEQFGVRKWSHIAQMLPGRIGKQCRERWHNHLRPDIKKDTWSEEEDRVLIQAHIEIGNKWAEIAKRLPGRTENSIKNHWNATKRRQFSKRKCRSKHPRCSLLQDYIKSLNLGSNAPRHQKKNAATATISNKTKSAEDQYHARTAEHSQPDDRLVPSFDFNGELEFCFDDNMFQEGCSVDSLIDEVSCGHGDDANDGDRLRPELAVGSVDYHQKQDFEMQKLQYCASYVIESKFEEDIRAPVDLVAECEVKKELDLVEMITQVNGSQ